MTIIFSEYYEISERRNNRNRHVYIIIVTVNTINY